MRLLWSIKTLEFLKKLKFTKETRVISTLLKVNSSSANNTSQQFPQYYTYYFMTRYNTENTTFPEWHVLAAVVGKYGGGNVWWDTALPTEKHFILEAKTNVSLLILYLLSKFLKMN